MPDNSTTVNGQNPICAEAIKRFYLCAEAEYQTRADSLDDLRFSVGDQWDVTLKTLRTAQQKPTLTMDQTQQSTRLVCNQYRQQPPAIQVNPIGDGADIKTADILQGIYRHIDLGCDAQATYEGVHEGTVRAGFASCRLLTEYIDDDSDQEEIVIAPIRNQFSVYWQPGMDQKDARWCFIVVDMPREEFNRKYPDSELAKMDANSYKTVMENSALPAKNQGSDTSPFSGIGNAFWLTKDMVRVAEYFTIEYVKRRGKRPRKEVRWRVINAIEILEGGEKGELQPGREIPVFTAYGDDLDVDGKRFIAGLIRNAKEPQRMVNYWYSTATAAMGLAPQTQWLVEIGQIPAGKEVNWEQANSGKYSVLYYKSVNAAGERVPPPQRISPEVAIDSVAALLNESKMNVKSAMGIYDPSLGQRKGDESGTAIQHLQTQGSIATLNYADNVGRMIRRLARVELDWIREVYDEARVQRIVNPDGTADMVVIHNGHEQKEDADQLAQENDITKVFDIGVGRYDIAFSVGPTYQSKRQEATATQAELLRNLPKEMVPILMPIMVRNMDIPQGNEIADMLKKLLPQQLQDANDPGAQVQQLQSQVNQLGQQHQQLVAALNQANDAIKTKQVENQAKVQIAQMESATKASIVKMQEATKLAVAQINASKDANQSFAENEIKQFEILHDSAHEVATQQVEHAHQQDMAQQQAAQAESSQAADQAHQQSMAQQAQESQGGEDANAQ